MPVSLLLRWKLRADSSLELVSLTTQTTLLHNSNYPGCFWQKVWLWQYQDMMVTAWNCHIPDFPHHTWHEGKNPAWSQYWWLFSWSNNLFVEYVFANNNEITAQVLLPWQPPIPDWDRKTGCFQNVTDCVVEDGKCVEVDCGGTLELENCCWATDKVCCQDWVWDCNR